MDRHKVIVEYAATIQPYASAARTLRAEIESLNASIIKSRTVSSAALQGVTADFNANLKGMRNWSTEMVQMDSNAARLGKSIERNQLSLAKQKTLLQEYRKGAVGARGAISELAKEQVRMSRSQVNFYDDANGRKQAAVSTPGGINFKSQATQIAVARQEMQIYNRVLMQNAEGTVNWGKNTQWAGRQIMVGMTVPLLMMGAAAKNIFLDVDKELTRMAKVYGGAVGIISDSTLEAVKKQVSELGTDIASEWGVSMKETVGLAADVAATGKEGEDLLVSTREAMRLSVLGEVDRQEALKATLSLQSAFKLSNEELVESVNLLNAVENQTSTSLQDLSLAIPKAGPVVQALGGDVGDLATMLVAMKEGGIQAGEGANAIKSGLASMINPTKRAREAAAGLGVDLGGIVERNKGELMPTLIEFRKELMKLSSFERAQLIEKIFGKYQFARISALFENLGREGSQSVAAMELAGASSVQLAQMADKEMSRLTDSASGRWNRAVESFKAQMVPIGEAITVVFTAVLGAVNKVLGVFNDLPGPLKTVVGTIAGIAALVGPILMIAGIFGNFIGQVMKGLAFLRGKKYGVFDMLTADMVAANAATNQLVDAQFNEKASLLEINGVMEQQIAILNELAAAHTRTAAATNGAAQAMTPPVNVVPGKGRKMDEVAVDAQTSQNINTTALGSRFLMDNPEAAKQWKDQAVGAQKELFKAITPEATASANAVAPAVGMFLDEQLKSSGVLDADKLYNNLMDQFPPGTANHEMAKKAAATVYHQLGVEQVPAELKKMIDKVPQGKRQGAGSMFRAIWAASAGEGAAAPLHPGNIHSGHIVPDAWDPGDLDKDGQPTKAAKNAKMTTLLGQIPQVAEENTLLGDSAKMSNKDIVRGWSLFGPQTAMQSHVLMESDPAVVQKAAAAKRTAGKDAETAEAFTSSRFSKEFEEWKKQLGSGRVNIMALRESLEKLVSAASAAARATMVVATDDLASAKQRVANSQDAVNAAKAEGRAVYDARKKVAEATKAQAAAAKFLHEKSPINATVQKDIARVIGNGTSDGMKLAVDRIQKRIGAITTPTGQLRKGETQAELTALKAASTKFQAAADKMAAAEQVASKATAAAAKAAADQLVAAKMGLTASKEQLTAANRQIASANEEFAAAQAEAVAAQTELLAAQTRAVGDMGEGIAGGVVDPNGPGGKPGGRMNSFAASMGGGSMMLGGAGMGIGMLTKNDTAMKFGEMALAMGMVAQVAGPVANGLSSLSQKVKDAGGGLPGALSSAKSGLMGFIGAINPVTLVLGSLAAVAALSYMSWKKLNDAVVASENAGKSSVDVTGVALDGAGSIVDPSLNVKDAQKSGFLKYKDAITQTGSYNTAIDELGKQRDIEDQVDYIQRNYEANLRIARQAYTGDKLKAKEQELAWYAKILAQEKGIAVAWVQAEKKIGESKAESTVAAVKAAEAAAAGVEENRSIVDKILDTMGRAEMASNSAASFGRIEGLKTDLQDARDSLVHLQSDLAFGFNEAIKASDGTADGIVAGLMPIADEWRKISLAGEGNFNSMRDKMKEGLPPFLHSAIDDAQTMDQAIMKIIAAMEAIPRNIEVAMNVTQGQGSELVPDGKGGFTLKDVNKNETKEESEAREAKRQMSYVVGMAEKSRLASSVSGELNKKINSSFNAEKEGAAYDKRIEGIEAADKAAERAHKREQERRKDAQDALKEQIDGKKKVIEGHQKVIEQHQKVIEKIGDETDAQKKALDKAKDIADFNRDRQKSDINYYDAIARGDHVGAANIRLEQQQASADQQYEQAGQSIDDKGASRVKSEEKKIEGEESKIEGVNKEIEALEVRISAIQKAGELSDRAFEKEKERRQDALEAIRKNKDAHLKAAQAKADADAAAETKARAGALKTYTDKIAYIEKMAGSNKWSMDKVHSETKAAYDSVAKYMGWSPDKAAEQARLMSNTLITAYSDALKGIGLDPKTGTRRKTRGKGGAITDKWIAPQISPPPSLAHEGTYVAQDHTTGKAGLRGDEVAKTLQVGEYVVRKEAVQKYGRGTFDNLNKMKAAPKMHTGGSVTGDSTRAGQGVYTAGLKRMQAGGFAGIAEHFNNEIIPNMLGAALAANAGPGSTALAGAGVKWGGVDPTGASPMAKASMARAMSDFTNLVGMCLQEVRGWYGIGAKYGSASKAWEGAKTKHRDSNPKLGAPVFWTGGNDGYGHIAMYMGKGQVRSTDRPTGQISNVPMSSFGGKLNYAGWAEDLNGKAISLRKGATIQKDNVLTNLHARETVLTAELSSSLKRGINGLSDVPAIIGGGAGVGQVYNEGERTFNITVNATPGMDVNDLADAMATAADRAEARVGG